MTQTATPAATTEARVSRTHPDHPSYRWVALSNTTLGMLLATINASIVLISLPAIFNGIQLNPLTPGNVSYLLWMLMGYMLVSAVLVVTLGRLGDMYGGYTLFNAGLLWLCAWSLVAGFSTNYVMLIVCRALQGLGAAAFLPASIMLLGKTYRPGPRKNLVFALYGAFAPLGFFVGILFGGLAGQFLNWRWYFWLGTIILAVVCAMAALSVPRSVVSRACSRIAATVLANTRSGASTALMTGILATTSASEVG